MFMHMVVDYLISIIHVLGRHQNVEYDTCTSIILQNYFKITSEVLSGTRIVILSELRSQISRYVATYAK